MKHIPYRGINPSQCQFPKALPGLPRNAHACIHTHIYTHAHTRMYTCTHMHRYTHMDAHVHACIHTHTHTHVHTYTHTHTYTDMHNTYAHAHAHECIHTQTYTHTHTHTCAPVFMHMNIVRLRNRLISRGNWRSLRLKLLRMKAITTILNGNMTRASKGECIRCFCDATMACKLDEHF